ncbi:MAG TPA: glycosyltransferase family 2 protein, partial [Thermoanaerobaculia bacterium]|nr:glycosyltransferase family 2 protein [Thermoanaerobaculia bacterium]
PPEVTAVITTHVRPLHVHEALASVRAETHKDMEIVIVDDGGAFAAPAGEPRPEVRVVRGESLGIGRARNLGLAAARGEFIIFLDDDDVALPHRIATLLSAARQSGASLCFGMTRRVVVGAAMTLDAVPTHLPSSGAVGFRDVLTCNPHVNSVLVQTAALRAIGGFDAEASHFDDWSAWLRVADRNAILWSVPDVVAEWRIHTGGLSAQLLTLRAMKTRLIALFERLQTCLSRENARAVAVAQRVVMANEIITYDDYVSAIAEAREIDRAPAAACHE